MRIRRAEQRGSTRQGWLESFHTFSFAEYRDTDQMGFRALRVINEDLVAPGQGFGRHPHRDMEIVSYVLEGALEHKDSMGTSAVIRPGDVQRLSAGTGVFHSEFNGSSSEPVHFLQIWIVPDRRGYDPSYELKSFSAADKRGRFRLVASTDGRDGSVKIHQDTSMYSGVFAPGEGARFDVVRGRGAWVHVARGAIELNGTRLEAGDGAAVEEPGELAVTGIEDAEVLVFDLA